MKCKKCKEEFEDGDLVAVGLALKGRGSKSLKPVRPARVFHDMPSVVRINQMIIHTRGLPEDCRMLTYGYFEQGIYYHGNVYSTYSIDRRSGVLAVGLNPTSNGLRVEGDISYLVSEKPLYRP
ncbi:MAG TPA: hypothetical protein VJH97_03860 [Candidatus Nanoarchaeia archaeon]|nr:hypothetical protein [Candidatus Nanoarchaeia archaeon]